MKIDPALLDEETTEWLTGNVQLSLISADNAIRYFELARSTQRWTRSESTLADLAIGAASAYILDDRIGYNALATCVVNVGIHRLPTGLAISPLSYLHQVSTLFCLEKWSEAAQVAERGIETTFIQADARADVVIMKATLFCVLARHSEAQQQITFLEQLIAGKAVSRKRAPYYSAWARLTNAYTKADWPSFTAALEEADAALLKFVTESAASVGSSGAGGPDGSDFLDYSAAALAKTALRRGCKIPSTCLSDIMWLGPQR